MSCGVEAKYDVIEIDESLFGKKQKYNRGRKTKKEWVFGLAQRETRKTSFHVVKDRKNDTLHPIICAVVEKESTVYHDDWIGYRKLHELGFKHGTVCHKETFKSAEGVCTNTIEGLWGNLKMRICSMHGLPAKELQGFLDEFSVRYYFGHNGSIFAPFWRLCTVAVYSKLKVQASTEEVDTVVKDH